MLNKYLFFFLLILPYGYSSAAWFTDIKESNSATAIKARIKPLAQCTIDGAAPAAELVLAPQDLAKYRYEKSCKVCHGAGIAGAPKFKSPDWKVRMKVGINALLASSIKGKGAMPPKGTCMNCSDEELKSAIEYMLPK